MAGCLRRLAVRVAPGRRTGAGAHSAGNGRERCRGEEGRGEGGERVGRLDSSCLTGLEAGVQSRRQGTRLQQISRSVCSQRSLSPPLYHSPRAGRQSRMVAVSVGGRVSAFPSQLGLIQIFHQFRFCLKIAISGERSPPDLEPGARPHPPSRRRRP